MTAEGDAASPAASGPRGRVVAVIQARMGSTRLPGKVLMELGRARVIDHVIARARRISAVDAFTVATTVETKDDALCAHLASVHPDVPVFRGPEADVLGRFAGAADALGADVVMRITADCPMLSPRVSETVLREFLASDCAYASNVHPRSFPRGLDTEVFTADALTAAAAEATAPDDREHVTTFLTRDPIRFPRLNVAHARDDSRHRWTVDTVADLEFARRVFALLIPDDPLFELEDVLQLLEERPDLARYESPAGSS